MVLSRVKKELEERYKEIKQMTEREKKYLKVRSYKCRIEYRYETILEYIEKLETKEVSKDNKLISKYGLFCDGSTMYYRKGKEKEPNYMGDILVELYLSRQNRSIRVGNVDIEGQITQSILAIAALNILDEFSGVVTKNGVLSLTEFLQVRGIHLYREITEEAKEKATEIILKGEHKSDRLVIEKHKTENIVGYEIHSIKSEECKVDTKQPIPIKGWVNNSKTVEEYVLRETGKIVNRRKKAEREMYKDHKARVDMLKELRG